MVTRASPYGSLNSTKLRCNVTYEVVQEICRNIHFDISNYLILAQ